MRKGFIFLALSGVSLGLDKRDYGEPAPTNDYGSAPPPEGYCPPPTGGYCPSPVTTTVVETWIETTTEVEVSTETCFETVTETETCTVTLDYTITRDNTIYLTATEIDTEIEYVTKPTTVVETDLVTKATTVKETDFVTKPTTVVETDLVTKATTVKKTETATATRFRTTSVTILKPTTYVKTQTITNQYPVTVTHDHTDVRTQTVTRIDTTVTTITTAYAVVSTKTVALPPTTVVRLVTLPGKVTTLPGKTVTNVITQVNQGTTRTITITDVEGGSTITQPGSVTTVTEIEAFTTIATIFDTFTVSLCPSLTVPSTTSAARATATAKPVDVQSDLLYGCKPGYVCSPAKPNGCNLYPGPPSTGYECQAQDCKPAPPIVNTSQILPGTGYVQPQPGYFILDPRAFGLSYDIFEYETFVEVGDGHTITITTGDWTSQASLTHYPPTTASSASTSCSTDDYVSIGYDYPRRNRGLSYINKRQAPSTTDMNTFNNTCYLPCNSAYTQFQNLGLIPTLCTTDVFTRAANLCVNCLTPHGSIDKISSNDGLSDDMVSKIEACNGGTFTTFPTTTGTSPLSEVTGSQTLTTASQDQGNTSGGVIPITTSRQPTPTPSPSSTTTVSSTKTSSSSSPSSPSSSATATSTSSSAITTPTSEPSSSLPVQTSSSSGISGSVPSIPTVPTATTVPTASASKLATSTSLLATLIVMMTIFF